MKNLQVRKRLATFTVMVIGATLLALTLMFTGFSLDSLVDLPEEVQVSSVTAVTERENVQQAIPTIERDPMADSFPAFESMSPADALTNGKPTLLFFQPYELCQSRYCRNPALLADELQAGYQDGVNFVYVTTYAMPDYDGPEPYPQLLYHNWDLYPVGSYSEWLPKPTMTENGLSLEAPVVLLIDSSGNRVYQGDEFSTIDEIEPDLQVLIGDQ